MRFLIPDNVKSNLLFDNEGQAKIEKDERDVDSHNYRFQITLGGAGLRMISHSERTHLPAWRVEVVELENGDIELTETVELSNASRSDDFDKHIKDRQKTPLDTLMVKAFPHYKQLW